MSPFLVLALLVLAAGSAQAQYPQYPSPYAPAPPGYGYGSQQPIYIPTPGHPAEEPPDDAPDSPGNQPTSLYPTAPDAAHALLAPQNAVRARVGEAPLTWSDTLADAARDWAQRLIASGRFEHRPGNRYGENLYEITGGTASPDQVVSAWADEASDYDLRTNRCTGMCGHYTQIVWQTTREVGCAVASDGRREVWDCEYAPPGNVVGYRPF